jgi:hypothetical protein
MLKRKWLKGIIILSAAFLLLSCKLPDLFRTTLREFLNQNVASQSPTSAVTSNPTEEPEGLSTPEEITISMIDRSVKVESESPAYLIEGTWPNLSGPEEKIARFNDQIDRLVENIQEDFVASVEEYGPGQEGQGQAPVSALRFTYELTYSDQFHFSLLLKFDQYIAMSAHPFPFSHALNYDGQNAQFLQLEDLFMPEMNVIEAIGSRVDPVLLGRDISYEVGRAAEVMRQRENWNMHPGGLQINFDVYEVGPYAVGPQSVLIPWEDLAEILDPNGPAAGFIE